MEAKPDWKHTYTIKEKDYTAVHVGLGMKGTFSFITPENRKAYETTGDKRYLKTFTRMIVLTNKKNKSTSGFLMTLVPDKAYYESTHFNALRSNYKQWQKGYSGYVFYHTLEGKFINAWKFENGKVIKKVTQTSNDDIDIDMGAKKKAASNFICTTETWVVWHQTCTTVIYSSESFYIDCGDWYYGYSFTTTNCVDDGEGNTGGGGPGTDCEGVVGGSAYYDNCQECVGGSTGKTECTECEQLNNELAAIFNESSELMAARRKSNLFENQGRCAPEGSIYRNGQVVSWNSIPNTSESHIGVTISYSKQILNNNDAIELIKGRRDLYGRISNYGSSSVGGTFALEKLASWLLKKANNSILSCLTAIYTLKFKELNSLYSDLYDSYNEKTDKTGCYVITTTITPTGAPVAGVNNTTEEYYDKNGCLIDILNYNN